MADDDSREQRIRVYLERAEEARKLGRRARDPEAKETFEVIAKGWEELAARVRAAKGVG
jgi:hypothetical protein